MIEGERVRRHGKFRAEQMQCRMIQVMRVYFKRSRPNIAYDVRSKDSS